MLEKLWNVPSGEPHLPIKKALHKIAASTLLVSGSIAFCLFLYFHLKALETHDPCYCMIQIQQSGPDKGRIPSQYLADILDIPLNQLFPFSHVDSKKATNKLLGHPLIKTATIKKVIPNTLLINYTLRHPVAILIDIPETALDAEGYLIPFPSFFSSNHLPDISLGDLRGAEWGKIPSIDGIPIVLSLLKYFENSQLQSIDLSTIDAPSVGQREIVVTLQEECLRETDGKSQRCLHPRILRFHPENYRQQLANYQVLRDYLLAQEKDKEPIGSESTLTLPTKTIDLRIAHLAFLQAE